MNQTDKAVEEFRAFAHHLCRTTEAVKATDEYLDDMLKLVRQHEHRKTVRTETLRYMVIIRRAREDAIQTGRQIERQRRP
jgi:hypothetical protein